MDHGFMFQELFPKPYPPPRPPVAYAHSPVNFILHALNVVTGFDQYLRF